MAMARTCDACGNGLKGARFMEVTMRLLRTAEDEDQDSLEWLCGDYCPSCIKTGAAVQDLVRGFKKHPQPGLKQRVVRR